MSYPGICVCGGLAMCFVPTGPFSSSRAPMSLHGGSGRFDLT